MTRGWGIFWTITAAIVVPGGVWIGLGIRNLMKIDYKVIGYKIEGIGLNSVDLSFTLKIINPSKLKVDIDGYNIVVAINGVNVALVATNKHKTLEAEKSVTIELPVKIDTKKTFGQLKSQQLLSDFAEKKYDEIFISLNGKLKGRLLGVPASVKINEKMTVADIIKTMSEPSEA